MRCVWHRIPKVFCFFFSENEGEIFEQIFGPSSSSRTRLQEGSFKEGTRRSFSRKNAAKLHYECTRVGESEMGHQTCLLFFFSQFYWFLPLDPEEGIIPETNRRLTHLFLFALGSGVVTTTFLPSPRTCHGFPANIFAPDCTSFYFFRNPQRSSLRLRPPTVSEER